MVSSFQIQAKKSLKQRLDFLDKKELQLWSELLMFRLVLSRKNGFTYVQISFTFTLNIIEATAAFLRKKRIATMVKFALISS